MALYTSENIEMENIVLLTGSLEEFFLSPQILRIIPKYKLLGTFAPKDSLN